jgi:hypothetical protein
MTRGSAVPNAAHVVAQVKLPAGHAKVRSVARRSPRFVATTTPSPPGVGTSAMLKTFVTPSVGRFPVMSRNFVAPASVVRNTWTPFVTTSVRQSFGFAARAVTGPE